jgi:hypothetical protein
MLHYRVCTHTSILFYQISLLLVSMTCGVHLGRVERRYFWLHVLGYYSNVQICSNLQIKKEINSILVSYSYVILLIEILGH